MVEVTVESIRVSLINQQRLVVLREKGSQRFLPIWIGAFEAEAITMGLQGTEVSIFVNEDVMDRAGQLPAPEYQEADTAPGDGADRLGVFREFIEGLDLGETPDAEN